MVTLFIPLVISKSVLVIILNVLKQSPCLLDIIIFRLNFFIRSVKKC